MRLNVYTGTYVPTETESQEMADLLYSKPIIVNWKIVAGPTNIHPLNLYDVILDDYDFKIRKMDPKTHKFINYV